jgi:prepilin-type N-terminal cleavage/methylation domain-containing protein
MAMCLARCGWGEAAEGAQGMMIAMDLPVGGRRLPVPGAPVRRGRRGFTLVELLVVLAMGAILMLIGMPALLNIGQKYRVHSSAQQLMMLGRQARYQAIEKGMQVSVVPDPTHNMFYVIASTPPPVAGTFPNGYSDFAATSRVALWQVPNGVTFTATMLTYNSDGSGSGGPVAFNSLNQPTYHVVMTSTATGKLVVQ